jgi:hypothetical protein
MWGKSVLFCNSIIQIISKHELKAKKFFNFTIIVSMNADKIWRDFKGKNWNVGHLVHFFTSYASL